ncbi:hypothetical protein D3C80_1977870 [compost metagenome]
MFFLVFLFFFLIPLVDWLPLLTSVMEETEEQLLVDFFFLVGAVLVVVIELLDNDTGLG